MTHGRVRRALEVAHEAQQQLGVPLATFTATLAAYEVAGVTPAARLAAWRRLDLERRIGRVDISLDAFAETLHELDAMRRAWEAERATLALLRGQEQ